MSHSKWFTVLPERCEAMRKLFDSLSFSQRHPDLTFAKAGQNFPEALFQEYLEWTLSGRVLWPNDTFDESYYLQTYADVAKVVHGGGLISGFEHYVTWGQTEGRMTMRLDGLATPKAQRLREDLARQGRLQEIGMEAKQFFKDDNLSSPHAFPDALIAEYLTARDLWLGKVPSVGFDEHFYLLYYKDVRDAVEAGDIPSGFLHYLISGKDEGRVSTHDVSALLKTKLGQLAEPTRIDNIAGIERRFSGIHSDTLLDQADTTYNIFIPSLDPDIMFGGYIAFLHFLCRLREAGKSLRFFVCEDGQSNREWFLENISQRQRWVAAFEDVSFFNISSGDPVLVGENDICVAYSVWTAHDAHSVAKKLRRKEILFFIQEYEPVFHPHDSLNFLANSAYRLPHHAIFNTGILRDYFKKNEIGVFKSGHEGQHLAFQHALANVRGEISAIQNSTNRRLLFYARPEGHAERNLFEVGVVALRKAVNEGIFENGWEFHGIGSLGANYRIELAPFRPLEIISRVPQNEYEGMLRSFDIGLSLMWAPHPGVFPFELANAGVVTVLNTFPGRDAEFLEGLSYNLVACEPTIDSIVESLRRATGKIHDAERRVAGRLAWPTDWDEVFNSQFIEDAARMCERDH